MTEVIKDKELIGSLIEIVLHDLGIGDKIYNYYANTAKIIPNKAIPISDFYELFYPMYYGELQNDLDLHNKKIFLSIPITGVEEQARERCKSIKELFSKHFKDCQLFTPFEIAPEKDMPTSYYMGKDVEQLLECDVMIQMDGWQNSKGCTVENCIAETYGIPKLPIEYFVLE